MKNMIQCFDGESFVFIGHVFLNSEVHCYDNCYGFGVVVISKNFNKGSSRHNHTISLGTV